MLHIADNFNTTSFHIHLALLLLETTKTIIQNTHFVSTGKSYINSKNEEALVQH